jgi:hypothetical protein
MQYSITPGWHATDLLPTFYNAELSLNIFGNDVEVPLIPLFGSFSTAYQSYFTSFVRTGDPNTHRTVLNIPTAIYWPHPNNDEQLSNVLDVTDLGMNYPP